MVHGGPLAYRTLVCCCQRVVLTRNHARIVACWWFITRVRVRTGTGTGTYVVAIGLLYSSPSYFKAACPFF